MASVATRKPTSEEVVFAERTMQFLAHMGLNQTLEIFNDEWAKVYDPTTTAATTASATTAQQPMTNPAMSTSVQSADSGLMEEADQDKSLDQHLHVIGQKHQPSNSPSGIGPTHADQQRNHEHDKRSPAAEQAKSSASTKDSASPKKEPSQPGEISAEVDADSTSIWSKDELGVVSTKGTPDELWSIEDYDDASAPRFPFGGGIDEDTKRKVMSDAEDDFVPSKPYLKEAPVSSGQLESFDLRVIYEAGKTGFEEAKEFPIVINSVIAGRYQITDYLGSAAFSRAVQCIDLKYGHPVCIKIIRNTKDFFDQALDEVKLLQYINGAKDPDEVHTLQLYDYFYYKEHMFLVCELLRDNLYEFAKYNRENEEEFYFTMPRLQKIARQVLTALDFMHSLNLLHCDLKPENILIKSYSRCEVKVIDFGSSCFTSDNLSSYIQSRCYRAPEVVLGCHYDGRIDVWSLGCILPELLTGKVLFHNSTVAGMLARIAGICGPYSEHMLHEGRHACRFFTKHGVAYEFVADEDGDEEVVLHYPKKTHLHQHIGTKDELFYDFIAQCLVVDHQKRPTARQLMAHPFLEFDYKAAEAKKQEIDKR